MTKEKNTKDAINTYLSKSKANVNIGYNPITDNLYSFYLIASLQYSPITISPSAATYFS